MGKYFLNNKRDLTLTIIKLISVLVLTIGGMVNYDLPARMKYLMYYNGYAGSIAFIVLWSFSIIGLFCIAFIPKISARIILTLIVFLSTWIGVGYTNISGTYITYDSLYVLVENSNFTGSAITQYTYEILKALFIASFSLLFLLPNPTIIKNYLKGKIRNYLIFALPVISFFMYLTLSISRGGYGLEQTAIQYNIPTLLTLMESEKLLFKENVRNTVNYAHIDTCKSDKINIAIIVDESMRGDYLDLYQDRGLTPYLFSVRERIINFGYAGSGANLSAESNQILRYGPNVNNFGQTFKSNPYVWQYAKRAGYRTILLDGQAIKGQLNDRISKDELRYIDTLIYIEGKESCEKDSKIAKFIADNISHKNNKPLFIYAVKSGLHFPYDVHVPKEKRKFGSNSKGYNVISKSDLVNSYKNGISYIIDPFFRILFENKTYKNSVILYTSDHGQNLLDNGLRISHGSMTNVSPYEGLVPLFVITDNDFYRKEFQSASVKNYNKASHFNIYPTALVIMGYDKKEVDKYHGKNLFDDITEPRKFNSGLLIVNRIGIGGARNSNQWNYLPDSLKAPAIDKKLKH